ncbi:hypothetical protein JCM10908_001420 [Rhodotorula pacifica]|uniref:fungal specific transcription factor domain-containing protein n=1 Tax=Rhodotorula pacifica TaxID=1495444 RepID=UPI0031794BA4
MAGPTMRVGEPRRLTQPLKRWERIVYQNLRNDEPDASLKENLLRAYWCWQAPTHLAVYRPLLTRDTALSGPYSSPFLLNVIFAHACRYSSLTDPDNAAQAFLRKAKLLLLEEMEKPTSITTIQGLIVLGGRECAVGRSSQGWLYTGMAIRMIKDLGIHLDGVNVAYLQTLPVEEREARRRVFWATYTWDKSISLALGRGPTFHEMGGRAPAKIVDDSDDDTLWTPYLTSDADKERLRDYPPQAALTSSTFRSFCGLSEIVNSILMQLYVSRAPRMQASLQTRANLDARLTEWWESVRSVCKVENPADREWAPPPYVLTLNLMRFTARILLYRPFMTSRDPIEAALAAQVASDCSRKIDALLRLHVKTFSYGNLVYIARYCVFVGATVAAHDVKRAADREDEIQDAASRLSFALRALEAGAPQSPAFLRSLQILRRQVQNPSMVAGTGSSRGEGLYPPTIPPPRTTQAPGAASSFASSSLTGMAPLPPTTGTAFVAEASSAIPSHFHPASQQLPLQPPFPQPQQQPSSASSVLDESWWTLPLFPEQQGDYYWTGGAAGWLDSGVGVGVGGVTSSSAGVAQAVSSAATALPAQWVGAGAADQQEHQQPQHRTTAGGNATMPPMSAFAWDAGLGADGSF